MHRRILFVFTWSQKVCLMNCCLQLHIDVLLWYEHGFMTTLGFSVDLWHKWLCTLYSHEEWWWKSWPWTGACCHLEPTWHCQKQNLHQLRELPGNCELFMTFFLVCHHFTRCNDVDIYLWLENSPSPPTHPKLALSLSYICTSNYVDARDVDWLYLRLFSTWTRIKLETQGHGRFLKFDILWFLSRIKDLVKSIAMIIVKVYV